MRNKYRLSIMIVLIIMLFMYIAGVVGVAYETNYFGGVNIKHFNDC